MFPDIGMKNYNSWVSILVKKKKSQEISDEKTDNFHLIDHLSV